LTAHRVPNPDTIAHGWTRPPAPMSNSAMPAKTRTALMWLISGATNLPDGALYPMAAVLLQRRVDADLICAVDDLAAAMDRGRGVRAATAALHALPRVPGRGDRALRRVGDAMLANPTRMPVTVLSASSAGWTTTVDVDGRVSESEPGRVALDQVAVYVPIEGGA
jgi:hypothetical protein